MPTLISDKYEAWEAETGALFYWLKASEGVLACFFAKASSCVGASCAAIMTASGCPCSKLRAAPFVFGLIASQLALVISFRFGREPRAADTALTIAVANPTAEAASLSN